MPVNVESEDLSSPALTGALPNDIHQDWPTFRAKVVALLDKAGEELQARADSGEHEYHTVFPAGGAFLGEPHFPLGHMMRVIGPISVRKSTKT